MSRRQRILQRYLLQAIYPKLDGTLSPVTYAYRPGYSTHMAVEQVMEVYRSTDIQQFFDRICWAALLAEVERLGIKPILVQWIEQQLKAGMVVDRRYMQMNQGVLQGGILSGALTNLYLREFDRRCLEMGQYCQLNHQRLAY